VERYPDIITASEDSGSPYYTNSSHLPVGYTEDIFAALDIQDNLQTLYTSGTVFHAFLGEKLPSWESAAALVRKIAENYRLPYYTMSPTYSICKTHGYLSGEHFTCPECGEPSEVYSRITGYYRPVQNWNVGKTQEYKARKEYNMEKSTQPNPKKPDALMAEEKGCADCDKTLLFTTATCPNCRIAVKMLDDAGIPYEKVLAEDVPELAAKLGIHQAPTLVSGGQLYTGPGAIKKFIAQ